MSLQNLKRPFPPEDMMDVDGGPPSFRPDDKLAKWIHETFISGTGPLVHEVHSHLVQADICCLWTTAMNARQQKEIVGQARIPSPQGERWSRAMAEYQRFEWFGREPDFLLIFYAPYVVTIEDAAWCALVEHELCHCAQAVDKEGERMFDEEGKPRYALKGHDVEEFVHVVQRYGVENGAGMTRQLVHAAMQAPTVAQADLRMACGTCLRMVA